MTLHTLAHVDSIGTVLLPFITFLLGAGFLGSGKPVRTDPSKLKGGLNGLAIVSLAGPFSNVIMAVILGPMAVAMYRILPPLAMMTIEKAFAGIGMNSQQVGDATIPNMTIGITSVPICNDEKHCNLRSTHF